MFCIICKENQGDLKRFTDKTWGKMKMSAESSLRLKSDRYKEATMEVTMQQEMGNARFHSKCYGFYTAVKKVPVPSVSQNSSQSEEQNTRSRSSMPTSDAKGLLKGSCIFCPVLCKTINRKVEPLSDCLTKDGCDSIYAAAPRSGNERVKALVRSGMDLID